MKLVNKVIWTAAKCGDADAALRIFHEMEQDQCVRNIITYNGVLAALGSSGRVHEALYSVFISQMVSSQTIKPNYITYLQLANGIKSLQDSYEEEEKVALLWRIYEHMDGSARSIDIGGPIMEALITSYGKLGHYDEAKMIYNSINGPVNAGCLRAILSACSEADPPEWEECVEILHTSDIVSEAVSPTYIDSGALRYAMLACSRANQWEESYNLLQLYGSNTKSVSIIAMNSLIASCGRSHRCDIVMEILNNELSLYGLKPDIFTYRNAIIACNQAEHLEKKLERKANMNNDLSNIPDDDNTDRKSLSSFHFQWWECAISLLQRRTRYSNTIICYQRM